MADEYKLPGSEGGLYTDQFYNDISREAKMFYRGDQQLGKVMGKPAPEWNEETRARYEQRAIVRAEQRAAVRSFAEVEYKKRFNEDLDWNAVDKMVDKNKNPVAQVLLRSKDPEMRQKGLNWIEKQRQTQ